MLRVQVKKYEILAARIIAMEWHAKKIEKSESFKELNAANSSAFSNIKWIRLYDLQGFKAIYLCDKEPK